ncbi:hypothetical protein BJX68DRAFT_136243 [Aspergillus pseudodeflectus]|uniref:Ubiquitin conjugating enzyme n=1 Tax=Aspergillus pseudodeflectus TaxID=176178 RepID=A0ABR4JYK9_9EURO
MSSIGDLLVRRGAEMISARLQSRQQAELIHGWLGLAILILTGFAFIFMIFWVEYTCTHVIATLAAVEVSDSHAYIRLDSENTPDNSLGEDSKPITSGLRSAVKHLRARGGGSIWSTFRAFRMFLAFTGFNMVVGVVVGALGATAIPIDSVIPSALSQFVSSMLSATWQMAWVHLVIADKSPRSSYRRKLGLQHWPRIAPAAALYSGLMCVGFSLKAHAAARLAASTFLDTGEYTKGILNFILLGVLPALLMFFVTLPAKAVFVRVAASMLPEEDEPIVPFDRAFGGKVRATGELGLLDAWKTFGWAARKRFLVIIVKALAIEAALCLVAVLLVMGEMAIVIRTGPPPL